MAVSAPRVSLIIPTYLSSNQRYLDLCLESIANLDYPKDRIETIIVSSGGFKPTPNNTVRFILRDERLHYAEAINLGVANAGEDTDYYFLLSDDIILTKDSLSNLIRTEWKQGVILGPISNCDNFRKYSLQFPLGLNKMQYRYESLIEIKTALMNATSLYPPGIWFQDVLCFYAVLIPKSIWETIGSLDETFKSGQEDVDYCLRAKDKKIAVAVDSSALIWHFSGVTADQTMNAEIRQTNLDEFEKKWGFKLNEPPVTHQE